MTTHEIKVSSRDELLEKALAYQAGLSLRKFYPLAWEVVEPGTEFVPNWHIDAIADHLEAVTRGEIKRLVINMPPGYMKPVQEDEPVTVLGRCRVALKDVVVGDMILTHMGRFRRVDEVHVQGRLPIVKVTTRRGRELRCAPDHPVLTPRGWVDAGKLNDKDFVGIVSPDQDPGAETMPEYEASLLGYLIGDGHCRADGQPTITASDDIEIDDIVRCATLMGFDYRIRAVGKGIVRAVCLKSGNVRPNPIRAWMVRHDINGKNSHNKRIPDSVIRGNREVVSAFLSAYWTCDGYVSKDAGERGSSAGCASVSRALMTDVQQLLTRFGIHSTIRKKVRIIKTKKQGDSYTSYDLTISTIHDGAKLGAFLNMKHAKSSRLAKFYRTDFDRTVVPDAVVSVVPDGDSACRCLTVSDDHSFVASDIAVHNSRAVTVMWPCWEWIHKPSLRYLCASFSANLAIDHNIERRRIIESAWYRRHWGHLFTLEGDDNQKTQFTNDKRGRMITAGVTAGALGRGGERILIDDPLDPAAAASEAERKTAENWFLRTMPTRLRDKKNGAIVIVMQRLHERDTSALALEQGYEHLCLPGEYDPARSKVTVIGWKDPRTEPGELLWPEREGAKETAAIKASLGSAAFAGQYQQTPQPEGGGIFKRIWFRYYESHETPAGGYGFATVDLATSTKTTADYTVIASWRFAGGKLYLLDLVRVRLEGPDIVPAIRNALKARSLSAAYIEKVGFQLAIVQQARREGLPVREFVPDKDKVSRAMAATPRMEGGSVWFPANASFLGILEGELLSFPNAAHDDVVDTVSMAVLVAPWSMGGEIIATLPTAKVNGARSELASMRPAGKLFGNR